jgi:hypothetical protein
MRTASVSKPDGEDLIPILLKSILRSLFISQFSLHKRLVRILHIGKEQIHRRDRLASGRLL